MANDTKYTHQTKFNITTARSDLGTMHKETEVAYMFTGGSATVEAKIGNPPVFYKKDSPIRELFETITKDYRNGGGEY